MTGTEREYNPWIITKHDISENLAEFIARRENWNIDQIRNCPERVARLLAENRAIISGHDIYFVDFGGYFGYSCLVYLNGHQLRYAAETERDYYGNIPRQELYRRYTDSMGKKLFTEEELCATLKSYKEYKRRETYLRNYLGDAENRISSFGIFNNEEVRRLHKQATEGLYYSNITFSSMRIKHSRKNFLRCMRACIKQNRIHLMIMTIGKMLLCMSTKTMSVLSETAMILSYPR